MTPRHLIRLLSAALVPLGTAIFAGAAHAEVQIKAEVIAAGTPTSTVRFTFTGNLAELSPQINLQEFLFIDFGDSPALTGSLPNSIDLTSFSTNTAKTGRNASITTMEVRKNDGYFSRLSFIFTLPFLASDSLAANSVLELQVPTTTPITSADFNNLKVYWSFPAWGTNFGRGSLAGIVNPVTAPAATIQIATSPGGPTVIEFTGTLEFSPDLVTPFAPVPGAVSPYTVPAGSPERMFYRASDD